MYNSDGKEWIIEGYGKEWILKFFGGMLWIKRMY
jgi:hypothetical protein